MQGIDGLMFKGDASHKLTKLICLNTDEKVYHGLYTLMTFVRANNEFFLSTTDVYDEPLNQFNQINNSELATVGWSDNSANPVGTFLIFIINRLRTQISNLAFHY